MNIPAKYAERLERARRHQLCISLGLPAATADYAHGPYHPCRAPRDADVYIGQRADGLVKIGASGKPAQRRVALKLSRFCVLPAMGKNFESNVIRHFAEHRADGERGLEWFEPSPEILAFFNRCEEAVA